MIRISWFTSLILFEILHGLTTNKIFFNFPVIEFLNDKPQYKLFYKAEIIFLNSQEILKKENFVNNFKFIYTHKKCNKKKLINLCVYEAMEQ